MLLKSDLTTIEMFTTSATTLHFLKSQAPEKSQDWQKVYQISQDTENEKCVMKINMKCVVTITSRAKNSQRKKRSVTLNLQITMFTSYNNNNNNNKRLFSH